MRISVCQEGEKLPEDWNLICRDVTLETSDAGGFVTRSTFRLRFDPRGQTALDPYGNSKTYRFAIPFSDADKTVVFHAVCTGGTRRSEGDTELDFDVVSDLTYYTGRNPRAGQPPAVWWKDETGKTDFELLRRTLYDPTTLTKEHPKMNLTEPVAWNTPRTENRMAGPAAGPVRAFNKTNLKEALQNRLEALKAAQDTYENRVKELLKTPDAFEAWMGRKVGEAYNGDYTDLIAFIANTTKEEGLSKGDRGRGVKRRMERIENLLTLLDLVDGDIYEMDESEVVYLLSED